MSGKLTAGQDIVMVRDRPDGEPQHLASGWVTRIGRRWGHAEVTEGHVHEFDVATGYLRGDDKGDRIIAAPSPEGKGQ